MWTSLRLDVVDSLSTNVYVGKTDLEQRKVARVSAVVLPAIYMSVEERGALKPAIHEKVQLGCNKAQQSAGCLYWDAVL
jgi:hypothetical protein